MKAKSSATVPRQFGREEEACEKNMWASKGVALAPGDTMDCNEAGLKEHWHRRFRKKRQHLLSAEEFVDLLRAVYIHFCKFLSPSIAFLSRESGVPYETLRHFFKDPKHLLCPVNEEKLARALGHNSAYYRQLVLRYAHRKAIKSRLAGFSFQLILNALPWFQTLDIPSLVALESAF